MSAGRNELLGAIPTQRMESPARAAQQTWRPSPGYNPTPASDPKPPAAKNTGGKKGRGSTEPAWETSGQRQQRRNDEASYNKSRGMNPQPKPASGTVQPGTGMYAMNTPGPTKQNAIPQGAPVVQPRNVPQPPPPGNWRLAPGQSPTQKPTQPTVIDPFGNSSNANKRTGGMKI